MSEKRVLLVMREQGRRALLLAQLNDAGYDASGASTLSEALAVPSREPGRLPVELIIVDQHVAGEDQLLGDLLSRHSSPGLLYLDSALQRDEHRIPGTRLRYPITVGEVVRHVQRVLPTNRPGSQRPTHRPTDTPA